MATKSGGVGSSGNNLSNTRVSTGITMGENEYPIKIYFGVRSGGAYWTNPVRGKVYSCGVYLCDSDGNNSCYVTTISLGGGKSSTNDATYTVSGKSLMGKKLYLKLTGTVALRNWCPVTVTTEGATAADTGGTGVKIEKTWDPDVYKKLLPTVTNSSGMIGLARRAAWKVKVSGVDITDAIAKDLISLDITDNEEDDADDLQIKLADRDAVWLQKYLNDTIQKGAKTKGLRFTVWIGIKTDDGKVSQQKTGTFALDSAKSQGPPAVTTIKCTSLDYAGGIRTEKRDRAWENYDLRKVAQEIAASGGLKLLYCSTINPKFARREQNKETDIHFLIRLAQDVGLSVKVSDNQLILFERKQFENEKVIKTIKYGDGSYIKWDLGTTSGDVTYDICTVRYTNPATGACITGSYKSSEYAGNEEHQELVVTGVKVYSVAEAIDLAEIRLNLQNRFEKTATFTIPGNPAMISGLTMNLKGFGFWDGKYMINKVTHTISSSGYTTKLKLRKLH